MGRTALEIWSAGNRYRESELKPILDDPARRRAALAEFGAWLDTIVIDDDLIGRASQIENALVRRGLPRE